jgi:hypothetical protein
MSTVSQDTIRIIGRTFDVNCKTKIFNFDDITTYEQLHEFEDIKFELVSSVPTNVRSKLRGNLGSDTPSLNALRTYASIRIQPRTKDHLDVYFNEEEKRNVRDYKDFFTPYLTNVFPNGVLKNIVLLNEFKREYSLRSFEASKTTGTYLIDKGSIKANQRNTAQFKRAELLDANWDTHKNLLESDYRGIRTGKEVLFFHTNAARKLWDSVEAKLKSIGVDCIILDADNMTLAAKIYGPNKGYYPMWNKDQIDESGKIVISGDKLAMFKYPDIFGAPSANNITKYKTCDHTNGPSMFKIIKEGFQMPKYNWDSIRLQCGLTTGGKRRKTRSKKRSQRKTKRHL